MKVENFKYFECNEDNGISRQVTADYNTSTMRSFHFQGGEINHPTQILSSPREDLIYRYKMKFQAQMVQKLYIQKKILILILMCRWYNRSRCAFPHDKRLFKQFESVQSMSIFHINFNVVSRPNSLDVKII